MTGKYLYNGMDITMDVYDKIRSVIELIADEDGMTFDAVYEMLAGSRVLSSLQNPRTLMWSESPAFIAEEFRREASSLAR